jgi:chromosome segregation ATPase
MSISCSQQDTGEQVVGPAAALLARRVKAVEVQRDQALGDKDKVINRLQTGLESAIAEAKASAARLSQREAALIKQEAATAELRVSEQQALDGLDRMAAKLSETEGKVTSLEKVVQDQIDQRDELSMENRELVDANTKLAEENQEAQSAGAAAEAKVGNLQSLLEGAECNLSGEKNRVALLEAEVKSLTDTLTARAKDMTSVRMSVRDRDQTVNQLTLQLQEANDDNAAL